MSEQRGFTLWFTGLSGSGKTTIAGLVGPELERRGGLVEYLDGDVVRTHLSKESPKERMPAVPGGSQPSRLIWSLFAGTMNSELPSASTSTTRGYSMAVLDVFAM